MSSASNVIRLYSFIRFNFLCSGHLKHHQISIIILRRWRQRRRDDNQLHSLWSTIFDIRLPSWFTWTSTSIANKPHFLFEIYFYIFLPSFLRRFHLLGGVCARRALHIVYPRHLPSVAQWWTLNNFPMVECTHTVYRSYRYQCHRRFIHTHT